MLFRYQTPLKGARMRRAWYAGAMNKVTFEGESHRWKDRSTLDSGRQTTDDYESFVYLVTPKEGAGGWGSYG